MKQRYPNLFLLVFALLAVLSQKAEAQCGVGYNQASLNWDYLDYFPYLNNYTSGNGYLPSNTYSRTQNFAIGKNRVTISHAISDANSLGDDSLHTGETGAYGTGADIHFNSSGTITFTFETEVYGVKFSVFDIDNNANLSVSAVNSASVAMPVVLTKANLASLSIAINPIPLTAPVATATGSNIASTANDNTINVDIVGPVKTFTINVGATSGDFWVSDLTVCTTGTFASNYYNVSQPFTGQAGYVLFAFNRDVYYLNPTNGFARLLFSDNTTPLGAITGSNRCYINSMAYDPYNRVLYYVYSLSSNPGVNALLRKYDFNTGTISTVLSDISSTVYGTGVGIPLVTQTSGNTTRGTGVESGAAAFYDGSLYIGIETPNRSSSGVLGTSNREVVIWRVDFDGSGVAYRSSQVFALPVDNGSGSLTHDWSDFTITNGILYDFDGAGGTTNTDVFHYNMMTGATVRYALPAGWTPGQPTVNYNNDVYQIYALAGSSPIDPYVALYNMNGTENTRIDIFSNPMYTPAQPSLGDAAEGFRPFCDFGDAPASYDPNALSPAVHEYFDNIRLGASWDSEWIKISSAAANADGGDEDGIATVPLLDTGTFNYAIDVDVYNNSGANATVGAWLDYDGDGVFEPGEYVSATVPTSASIQTITLVWWTINTPLTLGQSTYLRVRAVPASYSMTSASATGFYLTGEVEDYQVSISSVLPVDLLNFEAKLGRDQFVELNWNTARETNIGSYQVERSADKLNWTLVGSSEARNRTEEQSYNLVDYSPLSGTSYYRLRVLDKLTGQTEKYSQIRSVTIKPRTSGFLIKPNPVISGQSQLNLTIFGKSGEEKIIRIVDMQGNMVHEQKVIMNSNSQDVIIPSERVFSAGTYVVSVSSKAKIYTQKLVVTH